MVSADVILAGEGKKAEARRAFEQHGFTVQDVGASLVIEGDRETFERALGVDLEVVEDPAPGDPVATTSKEPELPAEMRGLVTAVAFQKRAHMFGQPSAKGRQGNGKG